MRSLFWILTLGWLFYAIMRIAKNIKIVKQNDPTIRSNKNSKTPKTDKMDIQDAEFEEIK